MKPIRFLFGGSNRRHHTKMAKFLAYCLVGGGSAIAVVTLSTDTIVYASMASLGCYWMDKWATPDRDCHDEHPYWWLFAKIVHHRSSISHSIPVGTLIRLVIGFWPLIPVLYWISPGLLLAWVIGCMVSDAGHLALDWF